MPQSSKNKICVHCGDPAVCLCTWPVRRFVSVLVSELDSGDTVRVEHGAADAQVRSIEKDENDCFTIRLLYRIPMRVPFESVVKRLSSASALALRDATCDAPSCDMCARDPADDKNRVCRVHWDAWEKVA